MSNRALSSLSSQWIGGILRAGHILSPLALLALSACGVSGAASIARSADVASKPGDAGEVRLFELPSGYAWNFDRRLVGLSATLESVRDPSLCGDGIDESWSRLRASLDALDEQVRTASGGLVTVDSTSGVWIQSIEPIDRSIAAFTKKDAKVGADLTAGVSSVPITGEAGIHRSGSVSELLLGRQAYEVRLTHEALACIRLNTKLSGRDRASAPVWDRIVYGALEQTLVKASAFDVGGGSQVLMLRVKGGLEESEVAARVDQLGGHSRENASGAPEVKRLLTEQRLNELLAQTNQYYDRAAIIAMHEEAGAASDPMPVLGVATGEESQVGPETVVYFANTSDNDLDLWSGDLPRGLCVVSRGGPPIEDEVAVRAAAKRDLGKWFDTGEVRTRGDCAPIRGSRPIRYFLVNALTARLYQIDPNEISRHYHFKPMISSSDAAQASALAARAELSSKERNLWLLDKLRAGGSSLDAHRVLPEVPGDAASALRSAYYDRLLQVSYPSAADALRVLRSIARVRAAGNRYGQQASLGSAEGPILRVLAGNSSRELALQSFWPTAGNECKLQWHDEKAGEGGATPGEWRLFCRGHLLRLRNMEVWSSDFPADIAPPQRIAIGPDAPQGGQEGSQAYGYILGDLIFFRRDAMPQVLKALGEQVSRGDPSRTYSIKTSSTSGLEWTVMESAISEVMATEEALPITAPSNTRCIRHYVQGKIAQLVCEAPSGFVIDQEKLSMHTGLACQGSTRVVCTSGASRSMFGRAAAGLSIPLIAIPPPAPVASAEGGA
jgi:hypothetical protein